MKFKELRQCYRLSINEISSELTSVFSYKGMVFSSSLIVSAPTTVAEVPGIGE